MIKAYFYVAILAFLMITGSVLSFEESTTSKKVELTLAMKCGCAPDNTHTPAALSGVRITGQDGMGNSFDTITDVGGYAVIEGEPGNWQFVASKEGYVTNTWTMPVTKTETKYPFLLIDNSKWQNKVDASGSLSKEDLARIVMEKFPDGDVPGKSEESIRATAYAVAMAESSGNPSAFGDQALGYSVGLWQINLCHHQNYNALDLFDPGNNADAALEISNGGTYWYPWSTWKNGDYKAYLKEGQDELDKLSGIIPKVTLTLYIHDSDKKGPVIPGVRVTCKDGSGNHIEEMADSSGYVIIEGDPGTWSFTTSADGYETASWDQEIREKCTKRAILTKSTQQESAVTAGPVTLILYVHDGSASGPLISGARVTGMEGSGISFDRMTPNSGYVTIEGVPGTWSFRVSADGYETNSWDQEIAETCEKHAFLTKSATSDTTHSSENSVVGKWAFRFIRKGWESSSEKVTRGPDSKDEWDSTIEFHSDGTFTESTSYMTFTGEWIQNGDSIRLQDSQEFRDSSGNYASVSEASQSRDGIIDENTMSGSGSVLTHMTVTGDDSYSAEVSETYTWSANRID